MNVILTHHAGVERIDRIANCLALFGMNEFILEIKESSRLFRLTDTGILFVFDETGSVLITGYMATPEKVASMYKRAGYAQVPRNTWSVITRNSRTYRMKF